MTSERDALFVIYEQALVTTLDPKSDEWLDPSLECLSRRQAAVVMTAYNPGTARPTWAENEAANAQMFELLVAGGREVWRADGFSADGTWREPGWLVWGMSSQEACRVAAAFGQFAIYVFGEEGIRSVVACETHDDDAS